MNIDNITHLRLTHNAAFVYNGNCVGFVSQYDETNNGIKMCLDVSAPNKESFEAMRSVTDVGMLIRFSLTSHESLKGKDIPLRRDGKEVMKVKNSMPAIWKCERIGLFENSNLMYLDLVPYVSSEWYDSDDSDIVASSNRPVNRNNQRNHIDSENDDDEEDSDDDDDSDYVEN